MAGTGVDEAIESMPGISRQSVDVLMETIASDMKNGISSHMLFGVVESHEKDSTASKVSDSEMPLQRAVMQLKQKYGNEIVLMTDVCLCTATVLASVLACLGTCLGPSCICAEPVCVCQGLCELVLACLGLYRLPFVACWVCLGPSWC